MNQQKQNERAAQDAIQDAIGIPPTQLRGLSPADYLQGFMARSMAQDATNLTKPTPPDVTVKNTVTTNFPASNFAINEQPVSPATTVGGDGSAGGTITIRAVEIVSGSPTLTTLTVSTP